jgi:pseudouridine kinase
MYTCVIGASNIDIQGSPRGKLIPRDSNIGTVKISSGGVGRNIAENLARLKVDTKLISVVGDDGDGLRILEEARRIGLDTQETLVLPGAQTSVYLCILDETNDMALAINSMDIYERLTVDFIKSKKQVIENAALCILDTNIPAGVLEYILTAFKNTAFFLDPVSTVKAMKVRDLIGRFHTIKPNRIEAEALSGVALNDEADLKRAAAIFHQKGVSRVYITLGGDGVYYSAPGESGRVKAPELKIASATGAGDAFTAALALGYLRQMDASQCARLASAASAIALSHVNTINPAMSPDTLFSMVKELSL